MGVIEWIAELSEIMEIKEDVNMKTIKIIRYILSDIKKMLQGEYDFELEYKKYL